MRKIQIGEFDICSLQKVLVTMMQAVDKLCQENNIRYVLDGGTMLGAVRHKGFIPWDDDLDIMMPRDDYNRFIQIANEKLEDKYFFECLENTPEYPYNFGKVRMNGTIFKETFTKDLKIHHGVYIDVFPMDYIDENNLRKLAQKRKLISHYTQLRYAKQKMIYTKAKYLPFMIFPKSFFDWRVNKLMQYCKKSEKLQKLCHYGPNKPMVDITLFEQVIRVAFENCYFNIPKDYDFFLRGRYGNYMELPPEDERIPAHDVEEIYI